MAFFFLHNEPTSVDLLCTWICSLGDWLICKKVELNKLFWKWDFNKAAFSEDRIQKNLQLKMFSSPFLFSKEERKSVCLVFVTLSGFRWKRWHNAVEQGWGTPGLKRVGFRSKFYNCISSRQTYTQVTQYLDLNLNIYKMEKFILDIPISHIFPRDK